MTIRIIAARLGSKRTKNKNIKPFVGKSIISYVIRLAQSSCLFKRIVSTDNHKIAKKYSAEVPFLRSKKLANDFTPVKEILINCIKKITSQSTKYHSCLYPNTKLLFKKDLIK